MIKKRNFLITMGIVALNLFSLNYGTAQEEKENSLVLPDITTIISQEEILITEEAIPDFSGALPENLNTDTLPKVSDTENLKKDEISLQEEESKENSSLVFLEGEVGLGWPYVFDTNFSLYQFGEDPFSVNFIYDSFGGYGKHSQDMGFFDTEIEMETTKTFITKNSTLDLAASYKKQDLGLQGNSVVFDDINRQTVFASLGWTLPFEKGFELSMNIDNRWFSRFAGYAGDNLQNVVKDENVALSLFEAQPNINLSWQKEKLKLSLEGNWLGGFFFNSEEEMINRSQGNLYATLNFPRLNFETSIGIVYVHNGNKEKQTNLIFPFSLSTSVNFKLPFSEQDANLSLIGGLNSKSIDLFLLEKNNPFTLFSEKQIVANSEQTDWFGQTAIFVPIKEFVELGLVADFRKTAFENGILQTQQDEQFNSVTGLFNSKEVDSTRLFTNISISVNFTSFTANFAWNNQWIDKTPGQSTTSLIASLSFTTEKNWGLKLKLQENLGSENDKVPVLDFSAFIKPSEKTKILFTVTDTIKLVTGKDRIFIEPYIKQGGNISASVQFMY